MRLRRLPASFLLSFAACVPAHAAFLHLCPAAQAGAPGPPSADAASLAGRPLRWRVSMEPRLEGCESVALPAGAQVDTLFPLAAGETVERTILLHGRVRDGRFAISEHVLPSSRPGPPAPEPMPLRTNLLGAMRARSFGSEERVRATLQDGRLQLECDAGTRAAGVLLSGPWYLPHARVALAVDHGGDAGFSLQAADAALSARETALDVGALPPGHARTTRLPLPDAVAREGWRQFILLCPAAQASVTLTGLRLEPLAAAGQAAPRASWVWDAADWRERGPALLDWAAAHAVRALFITVPFRDGAVRDPRALGRFIRAAGARGMRVLSVDGDPHMVLPGQQPALARMARAYAAYNADAAPDERLAGLQFDVEPYLLPEYGTGPADWDARYLAMAATLRQAAGTLRLELVVPFWWQGKRALLDGLAPLVDALVVMDYRTDPAQIAAFAAPFLDWADRHGRQARIALEAGRIAPQTQRRYVRADGGQPAGLLHLGLGGAQVLALLRAPVAASGPQAFALESAREIDGSATTFHQDKAALLRLLPRLEADLEAWGPAFGGLALHELR